MIFSSFLEAKKKITFQFSVLEKKEYRFARVFSPTPFPLTPPLQWAPLPHVWGGEEQLRRGVFL